MGKSESKRANEISEVTRNIFSEIETIHSITFDNGTEFSEFENIEEFLHCKIYFTDKSSPWQRGLNEYTNRLIRQYLPKKTSFKNIKQKDLDLIAYKINSRPGKVLGYLTPYEVFYNMRL